MLRTKIETDGTALSVFWDTVSTDENTEASLKNSRDNHKPDPQQYLVPIVRPNEWH